MTGLESLIAFCLNDAPDFHTRLILDDVLAGKLDISEHLPYGELNECDDATRVLYGMALDIKFHGHALVWVHSGGDRVQVFNLPTALCSASPPTPEYPYGYWRVSNGEQWKAVDARDVTRVDRVDFDRVLKELSL